MATKSKDKPAAANEVVRITNKNGRDGYRRAGMKHVRGTVDHPAETISGEQLAVLKADKMLEVRVVQKSAEDARTA